MQAEQPANDQGLAGSSFDDDNLIYSITLLTKAGAQGTELFAVAALGGNRTRPHACPAELLRLVCDVLDA